jgi:hypothetical protein
MELFYQIQPEEQAKITFLIFQQKKACVLRADEYNSPASTAHVEKRTRM